LGHYIFNPRTENKTFDFVNLVGTLLLYPYLPLLNMEPTPLTQLINLRAQAEKASKTQQMYEKRVGGWLEWEDVQKARVAAMIKLSDAQTGTPATKRTLLRDAAALSLLSLIPPDRVGCIRKLRLGHTLKRKQGGGWSIDLSKQRDGHKTSRFCERSISPTHTPPLLVLLDHLFSPPQTAHSLHRFLTH
jgi:hypothetical protein